MGGFYHGNHDSMTHTVEDLKWDKFWGDWGYDISIYFM
jgi:hypothetical protein